MRRQSIRPTKLLHMPAAASIKSAARQRQQETLAVRNEQQQSDQARTKLMGKEKGVHVQEAVSIVEGTGHLALA